MGLTAVRIKDTSPKYNTPIFIYLPIAKSVIISNDVLVKIDYKRPFYVGNNKITKTIRQDCKSLLKYQSNLFTLKDETLWYKKDPSDVILKCDGRIVSVSNKFACVCSYISPISGKLEYTIKTPEELILTIDE